jgi:dTDP-4-dehydrorhamnose reductase
MSDSPAILVVGGDSLVGRHLVDFLRRRGDRVVETSRRSERIAAGALALDLATDPARWAPLPPLDGAVLCAAVARMQDCGADPLATAQVNVHGITALAERLAASGVPTVFLSSDKVFDGSRPRRRHDEATCPITEYGRQKAAAEAAMPRSAAILRLSKIVLPDLDLFRSWARDLRSGRPITPFEDLTLAPVPVELVAATIARLIDEQASGTFHLTGDHDVNYVAAAQVLAAALGSDPALIRPRPSGSGLPPCPHTTLDMSQERALWGLQPPETTATLAAIARKLAA